jgi:hypothetical protein
MTWQPCDRPYYWIGYAKVRPDDYHRTDCARAARQGKVPAWTPEDVANLTRRVRRMAAKA